MYDLAVQYMNTKVIYSVTSMHKYKNFRSSRLFRVILFLHVLASEVNERGKHIISIYKYKIYSGTLLPECDNIRAHRCQRNILAPR